ncbi:MAG: tetratricopeptide repeat protein [Anaerolineales bacterium]
MYLRSKKWSVRQKPRRTNWFNVIVLLLLIAAALYVNQFVLPTVAMPFIPTPTPTVSAATYIAQAEAYFAEGKMLPAIQAYEQALKSEPTNVSIYLALARTQIYAGQPEAAQQSAENALLLSPNNAIAHALQAWALDFQGKYLEAEAAIKRALELDPQSALAHAIYAEILVDSYINGVGTYDGLLKAIEESRLALSLDPNMLETRRARAYVLENTTNYEEAVAEYQAAIAINPNIADLHLGLGRSYRFLQVYDKAIEEFTRANALNPADPTPDLLISRTYASIGEFAKAIQYAETAVRDDPTNTALRGNLGVLYYRNFMWPEAAEQLKLVVSGGATEDNRPIRPIPLSNDVRIAEYYYTYGLVLARLNRCSEALQIAKELLERIPANTNAADSAQQIQQICLQNLSVTPTPFPLPVTPTP